MAKRPYRLAVLASHPIQYQAPLWRFLAVHPQLDLTVYFYSRHGLEVALDPGFGQAFTWDIPLIEGYTHHFLRNLSPRPRVGTFWGACHPSLAGELSPARYDAVLVHGWYSLSNWLAFATTGLRRLPVLLRATATPRTLRRGRAEAIEAVAHGAPGHSKVVGREIENIALPPGTTISAIVRGDTVMQAHHDTVIEADDHVILFLTERRQIDEVERLFQAGAKSG